MLSIMLFLIVLGVLRLLWVVTLHPLTRLEMHTLTKSRLADERHPPSLNHVIQNHCCHVGVFVIVTSVFVIVIYVFS
jgi:hypothetical protein